MTNRRNYHTEVWIDGKELTLQEIADLTPDFNYGMIYTRYSKGIRGDALLGERQAYIAKDHQDPIHTELYDPITKKELSVREIAATHDIDYSSIHKRYQHGYRGKDLYRPMAPGFQPIAQTEVYDEDGNELTLEEIADRYGIKLNTVRSRYTRGFRGNKLKRKPVQHYSSGLVQADGDGEDIKIKDLAKMTGINASTLYYRVEHGYQGEELLYGKKGKSEA